MSLLRDGYSPENFREKGHKLIDLLADYLSSQQQYSSKVFTKFEPEALTRVWEEKLHSGASFSEILDQFTEDSIHLHHPRYMGHQVSPVLPTAALADLVSALLNNGVGVYEMGSPTIAMERIVIQKIANQLGFSESAGGFLTSGGTLGNLTALLTARQQKAGKNAWKNGTAGQQYAVIVSEQAHYCIDRAVKIMGWGDEGVVKIPVDGSFRMDISSLEKAYNSSIAEGKKIIGVVGNACSTATGSFDPLEEIADFCADHNLWFHIDAAHGGAAAFSEKHASLLDGINRADSVVVDFHKMMMAPSLVTGVIFKESQHSYQTFSQQAKYLWDKEDAEWYNLGKRTFECTKDMMALKIFMSFQQYGPKLFEEIVDELFAKGRLLGKLITERSQFELAVKPQANIVCFRHLPRHGKDINEHNRRIREKIIENGEFFLVQTELNDNVYLRTSLMNIFTTKNDLKQLLDHIEETGIDII